MRKRLLLSLFVLLLCGSVGRAQRQYFPPGALDSSPRSDQLLSDWYSKQLRALDEPSLWSLSKTQNEEAYRFLWLRTFHHPVAIRIDVNADGTSQVISKMTSGAGGYDPGQLVLNSKSLLTKDQTDSFLGKIKEHQFWQLPTKRESGGLDGAQWILEGVKDGKYHIVDRWSPTDGPVRAIGLLMLNEFTNLKILKKEIY